MIQSQENSQTDGRREGQTLFHRILLATTRCLISTTAVDWHLKVKFIEYHVSLTKNYCTTVIMQKIISIHKFIHQILGSPELNGHTHFRPPYPKITEITFSFHEFAPACKKSFHSSSLFLRYS